MAVRPPRETERRCARCGHTTAGAPPKARTDAASGSAGGAPADAAAAAGATDAPPPPSALAGLPDCARCGAKSDFDPGLPGAGSFTRFFRGFGYAFRGLGFVAARPALYPWVIIPLILTVIVISLAIFLGMWGASALTDLATSDWKGWLWGTLSYVITGTAWLLVLVIAWVAWIEIGKICALPSSEIISRRVDAEKVGKLRAEGDAEGLVALGKETGREMGVAILHALLLLPLKVVILIALCWMCCLPYVGAFLWFAIPESYFFAYDYVDLPAARRGYAFHEKLSFLSRHRAETLGFGFAVVLFAMVPILNLLLFPTAAAGATLLYLDMARK